MLWNCCLRLFFVPNSGFSIVTACSGSVCSIVSLHSRSRSGLEQLNSATIESMGSSSGLPGLGLLSLCITDEWEEATVLACRDRCWLLFFIWLHFCFIRESSISSVGIAESLRFLI
uniref:Putative secreted protein n=1 Tax=Anopheles triannulatus TaxID=58253 RepID=A0A2M4B6A4_9DIPT